jgi:hypothetical protein
VISQEINISIENLFPCDTLHQCTYICCTTTVSYIYMHVYVLFFADEASQIVGLAFALLIQRAQHFKLVARVQPTSGCTHSYHM